MDIKTAVDAFGVLEKVQELGAKVHELSERPMVSVTTSW